MCRYTSYWAFIDSSGLTLIRGCFGTTSVGASSSYQKSNTEDNGNPREMAWLGDHGGTNQKLFTYLNSLLTTEASRP